MKHLYSALGQGSRRHGGSLTRASPRQHALTPPNHRSATKARRPPGLFQFPAVAVALAALPLSPFPSTVQDQAQALETWLWSATMTVGTQSTNLGYISEGFAGSFGSTPAQNFQAARSEISGTGYRFRRLFDRGGDQNLVLRFRSNDRGINQNLQLLAHDYVLRVGTAEFNFHGTNDHDSGAYLLATSGLSLTEGETIEVSLWGTGRRSVFGLVGDSDLDDKGLIEISNLDQLNTVRFDDDGTGIPANVPNGRFSEAFSDSQTNMGCPGTCAGYELRAGLDFDTNSNGVADPGDA